MAAVRRVAEAGSIPTGLCVAEGPHLVWEAVRAGLGLALVLHTADFAASREGAACLEAAAAAPGRGSRAVPGDLVPRERLLCVGPRAFAAASTVRSPRGVLALVVAPLVTGAPAPVPGRAEPATILALDGVQDPGNVGTVARALCAFAGAGAGLWLGAGTADPFGPKALRASAGAVFRLEVRALPELAPAVAASRARGRAWWALCAHGGAPLRPGEIRSPCGLVVGNEGHGISPQLLALCRPLTVPLCGPVESLSAPQAATVALYSASGSCVGGGGPAVPGGGPG